MSVELSEQTAPYVSAFVRNMKYGRLDAGLVNLEQINKLVDERIVDDIADVNGQAEQRDDGWDEPIEKPFDCDDPDFEPPVIDSEDDDA